MCEWQTGEYQELQDAIQNRNTQRASEILVRMDDVTVVGQTSLGRTPLHTAANMNCIDIVALLLPRMSNAAVGLTDGHDRTALHLAIEGDRASSSLVRAIVARMDDM